MFGATAITGITPNPLASSATPDILDDILFSLGNDRDQVMLNRSTSLTAATALTDVLTGTTEIPTIQANSLIISNVTEDGDLVLAVNDGGISKSLHIEGATGTLRVPNTILPQATGGLGKDSGTTFDYFRCTGGVLGQGNQAAIEVGIYVTGADSGTHDINIGIDGGNQLQVRATGNGSGGITTPLITASADFHMASAKKIIGDGTGANGIVLKNPKNTTASALSGTQLDVEIDIGGTPYHFTVYPTKA